MSNTPEWQEEINEWGGKRRFRIVGGIKEYECKVMTTSGEVAQSRITEHSRQVTESRAAEMEQSRKQSEDAERLRKVCPFSGQQCKRSRCAVYMDGCLFVSRFTGDPVKDTTGYECPFGHKCNIKCVLYNNGCMLTAERQVTKNESV